MNEKELGRSNIWKVRFMETEHSLHRLRIDRSLISCSLPQPFQNSEPACGKGLGSNTIEDRFFSPSLLCPRTGGVVSNRRHGWGYWDWAVAILKL